jgi:hypothetical protein
MIIALLSVGYHQQNLKIIRPKEAKVTDQIIGSAYAISAEDCEVLQDMLRPFLKPMLPRLNAFTGRDRTYRDDIKLRGDLTCAPLFDEFSRTLMS